jgi:hypothetical protein
LMDGNCELLGSLMQSIYVYSARCEHAARAGHAWGASRTQSRQHR